MRLTAVIALSLMLSGCAMVSKDFLALRDKQLKQKSTSMRYGINRVLVGYCINSMIMGGHVGNF